MTTDSRRPEMPTVGSARSLGAVSGRGDLRVGLFFDGVTFKIVSDHYLCEHWRQSRLSFRGIDRIVAEYLQASTGCAAHVAEKHLFIGVRGRESNGKRGLGLAPSFERVMQLSGVQSHYLERKPFGEKGVDTALTIEMLRLVWSGKINVAVLMATDGDFVPLAKEVRASGIPVILLGFHLPHSKRQPVYQSADLTDAVTVAIDMVEVIERPPVQFRAAVEELFCPRNLGSLAMRRCA